MAKFEKAQEYISTYLGAKRVWMRGIKRAKWFTTGMTSIKDGMAIFDSSEEDAKAREIYEKVKKPGNGLTPNAEPAARLKLHFMVAGTMAMRKQYAAGSDDMPRTVLDTFRYESANAQAARCGLEKIKTVIANMEKPKIKK